MKNSHIFSQVLRHVNWDKFASIVAKHEGDKAAKGITCRSQSIMMLFAHVAGFDSLREICQGMETQGGHLNHMGIEKVPKKSSLGYANQHRPWEIYRGHVRGHGGRAPSQDRPQKQAQRIQREAPEH